jgi:hypothetical protein
MGTEGRWSAEVTCEGRGLVVAAAFVDIPFVVEMGCCFLEGGDKPTKLPFPRRGRNRR